MLTSDVDEIDIGEDRLIIAAEYKVGEVCTVEDVLITFVDGWTADDVVTLCEVTWFAGTVDWDLDVIIDV